MLFQDMPLPEGLKKSLTARNFTTPTPIQSQALEILLGGEKTDIVALAATGTGKTLAFGLPALARIDAKSKNLQVLIMCPTRELAQQVFTEINLLARGVGVRCAVVFGGKGYQDQMSALRANPHVLVATPGRLLDHMRGDRIKLGHVSTLILDEADEMISMGFSDDIETVLEAVSKRPAGEVGDGRCQRWLFSATMAPAIQQISKKYLLNPKRIEVKKAANQPTLVDQRVIPVQGHSYKPEALRRILQAQTDFYGIVFCQTKIQVDRLAEDMLEGGIRVGVLHGDKSQAERERTLQLFRKKTITVLVATDVAARGLDVPDLTTIVNYELPRDPESYVHRIGRTGRNGKTGQAISLVSPSERGRQISIERVTRTRIPVMKVPSREDIAKLRGQSVLERLQERIVAREVNHWLEMPAWQDFIAKNSKEDLAAKILSLL